MNKLHVKKGDTVVVISGKDKGTVGKITRALPKENRVVVEGVNKVTRHTKARSMGEEGGRIDMFAPIHVSNVMLYDSKAKSGTRVSHEIKNNKKVRVSKKTGEQL